MKKVLFILGTRPEAIKLAPLILKFKEMKSYQALVCLTGQHERLPAQILKLFSLKKDFHLKTMRKSQPINFLLARLLQSLNKIIQKTKPHLCVVQGDTTTALAGALASFHQKIPVAHVEAGLRSGDIHSPFPEEMNRKLISQVATLHFAPTKKSAENLKREKIKKNVFITGNTVVDAIYFYRKNQSHFPPTRKIKTLLNTRKKIIFLTLHRRESFGKDVKSILETVKKIAYLPNVRIVYPVHHNPEVSRPSRAILGRGKNICMVKPLNYSDCLAVLSRADAIISDSGGIQEEAPSFGQRVLVTRKITERNEGISTGHSILVGANPQKIQREIEKLLAKKQKWKAENPYGNGKASALIFREVHKFLDD